MSGKKSGRLELIGAVARAYSTFAWRAKRPLAIAVVWALSLSLLLSQVSVITSGVIEFVALIAILAVATPIGVGLVIYEVGKTSESWEATDE